MEDSILKNNTQGSISSRTAFAMFVEFHANVYSIAILMILSSFWEILNFGGDKYFMRKCLWTMKIYFQSYGNDGSVSNSILIWEMKIRKQKLLISIIIPIVDLFVYKITVHHELPCTIPS